MEIKYICPYWGSDDLKVEEFIHKALAAGYDGVEMNISPDQNFDSELKATLKETKAIFIAQQWLEPKKENVSEYKKRMMERLEYLSSLNPVFINSHTGKDYYSVEENSQLLESCIDLSKSTGIPIVHETHRGRFSHHAYSLLPYLERFQALKLNADFSHFTNVSESLLEDQEDVLDQIIPRCSYIHARVGSDQNAQVNHPFAPEWQSYLDRFLGWWIQILSVAEDRGEKIFYICPEFGPFPYNQRLPFSQKEVSNQWDINVQMMEFLKDKFTY